MDHVPGPIDVNGLDTFLGVRDGCAGDVVTLPGVFPEFAVPQATIISVTGAATHQIFFITISSGGKRNCYRHSIGRLLTKDGICCVVHPERRSAVEARTALSTVSVPTFVATPR